MEKKSKIIIIIIIGILVTIILWSLFISEKGMQIVGRALEESLPKEESNSSVTNKITLTKEERAYKYITEIFELLNNKDYVKIYDLLKDDYKEYAFNNSYDIFKQYMAGYIGNNHYQPKFKGFYYKDDQFIVLTEFLKKSYTKEDLLSKKASYLDTIVIKEYAEGNFKFAFGGFMSSLELSKNVVTSNNIIVTPLRLTYLKDSGHIEFSIKNNSENSVTFSGIGCMVQTNYHADLNLSCSPSYNIPSGEGLTIKASFPYSYESISYIKGLSIKDISLGDKKINITVPLT